MPEIQLTSGARFALSHGASILQAAEEAGQLLPYSCKTGRCSTCRCKVLSGTTKLLAAETGLTDDEKCEGFVLSCVRTAIDDVVLQVQETLARRLPPQKIVPCRISALTRVAPVVLKVELCLPPTAEFEFVAGQYVDVIGPAGVRRSYSLAKGSCEGNILEFHIREFSNGVMSDYWFNHAKVNDLLRLHGPLGTFMLRDVSGLDLIFLATGTGIAPIKAMLETLHLLSAERQPRSVRTLWGGRVLSDLYWDVTSIAKDHHYYPVLSQAGEDWAGARGYVQDVLLRLASDLSQSAVYACGSLAMVHQARAVLEKAGLSPGRFFADAFVPSSGIATS
jgi:CDP-4-dehydro-6-deoxyglucose reductase, E3